MSVYRQDHNTIFIHVPKTAGSAMEQVDFLGGGGHQWIADYYNQFVPIIGHEAWSSIFKWGFVRNPWDRFVSVYFRWPPTRNHPDRFKHFVTVTMPRYGFNVPLMKRNRWRHLHHHFLPQRYFLCDNPGRLMVDFVGRYESVNDDWRTVCDMIGVDRVKLPLVNVGDHKPYQEYYDDQTRRIIGEFYAEDIEIFGYEFK
jgi:chondroitin 4-sulfotransferase 11